MWSGVKSIKFLSERLHRNDLSIRQFGEPDKSIDYTRKKIPIGICRETNDIFYMNMTKSVRLGIFAKTRTGKTFLGQSIASRYFYAGGKVAIPTDIKNEYHSCIRGVQADLQNGLLKQSNRFYQNEEPMGLPVRSYYPAFLDKMSMGKKVNPISEICQMRLEDMSSYDFITLADLKDVSPHQRFAIDSAFRDIKDGKIKTLDDFSMWVEKNTVIPSVSKPLIYSAIGSMKSDEVVGTEYPTPDFAQNVIDGFIPSLNLYGTLKAGKNLIFYASAMVAIILRQLYAAKSEGRIKDPLLIILDEVRSFCPKDKDPSSKGAILDLLRLSGSENIGQIYYFQDVKDAEEVIIKNLTYIFIPRNMPVDDMCHLIKQYAPKNYSNPYYFKQDVMRMRSAMRKFEWMVIDIDKGEIISTIKSLSPLCYHLKEST